MLTSRIKKALGPFKQNHCSWKQPVLLWHCLHYNLTKTPHLPSFGQGRHVGGRKLKEQAALPAGGRDASSPVLSHTRHWCITITSCSWRTVALAGVSIQVLLGPGRRQFQLMRSAGRSRCILETLPTCLMFLGCRGCVPSMHLPSEVLRPIFRGMGWA